MHPARADEMAALTAELFVRAGEVTELSERMAFAGTTVHLHFSDEDGEAACTVWLDREPIGAEVGVIGDAEIELFGDAQTFMDMILGKVQLAMAIARGDVTYSGPVRKFLRVVPILRTFDFAMFRGTPATNGASPGEAGRELGPSPPNTGPDQGNTF